LYHIWNVFKIGVQSLAERNFRFGKPNVSGKGTEFNFFVDSSIRRKDWCAQLIKPVSAAALPTRRFGNAPLLLRKALAVLSDFF